MSMSGCPLREWESDQIRVEATQVEADFLSKAIIGDFYLKLSKSQYTLLIALLIISGGTPLHTGQPMLEGVPILSQDATHSNTIYKRGFGTVGQELI
jgi:hypothetical protein